MVGGLGTQGKADTDPGEVVSTQRGLLHGEKIGGKTCEASYKGRSGEEDVVGNELRDKTVSNSFKNRGRRGKVKEPQSRFGPWYGFVVIW